ALRRRPKPAGSPPRRGRGGGRPVRRRQGRPPHPGRRGGGGGIRRPVPRPPRRPRTPLHRLRYLRAGLPPRGLPPLRDAGRRPAERPDLAVKLQTGWSSFVSVSEPSPLRSPVVVLEAPRLPAPTSHPEPATRPPSRSVERCNRIHGAHRGRTA